MDFCQHAGEAFEVHRLFEAVADRLSDEGMIRNLTITRDVLETGCGIRKDGSHEIVGLHPLELRRRLATPAESWNGKRDGRIPPPPRLKQRRVQQRLHENVLRRGGMEVAEHVGERERVLRSKR